MFDSNDTLRGIVNDPALSFAQKARYLSLEAENSLPYPPLAPETRAALDARVICDMYEGNAPYKPRYVLPDFSVVLAKGSDWLELPVPQTLDEALGIFGEYMLHALQLSVPTINKTIGKDVYVESEEG